MTTEFPCTHEYIDHLVSSGQAHPIWEDHPGEETDPEPYRWVWDSIASVDLSEKQREFVTMLSTGMSIAGASRLLGMSPSWGRKTVRTIRDNAVR